MKISTILLFGTGALISFLPAPVAAGDSQWPENAPSEPNTAPKESHPILPGQDRKPEGDGDGPKKPSDERSRERVQVLWGQCDGYYYKGTKKCPNGAYCRFFSDWYSQCNPKGY